MNSGDHQPEAVLGHSETLTGQGVSDERNLPPSLTGAQSQDTSKRNQSNPPIAMAQQTKKPTREKPTRQNQQEGYLLLDKVAGVVGKKPEIVNKPTIGKDPIDFSELEACYGLIAANPNTFEASGTLNRANYLDPLAGRNGHQVLQFGSESKDAAQARLKRVLATQERASELHFANREDDLVGSISQLIDEDEKILHRLPTVGYDPFPYVEEQLLFGRGEIILTDKRIIMTYAGDKMEASGQESRFEGLAGCCLAMFQHQVVTGKYEHLAHREFVSHVAVIDVHRQLCSAVTDHADQLDLVRTAQFENMKEPSKCCGCNWSLRCCCMCGLKCSLFSCTKLKAGGSDFQYSTGINSDSRAGSAMQDLIKEYTVGKDPGSWSTWDLESIKSITDPTSDEEWERIAGDLQDRTAEDCKQKYMELKEGVALFESCRVGRYRAVTLKYWDPVDPRLAREVACFVDPEVTSLMKLHSFSIAAMKLVCMKDLQTVNKMGGDLEILSAPTTVRDKVLKRGDKGRSLSNFFGGSAEMQAANIGKLGKEEKRWSSWCWC